MEEFRQIKGYEGLYEVSNRGRIRSVKRGIILKTKAEKDGYIRVCLCNNGLQKMFRVHRLVAGAFVPNPNGNKEVNHNDENKQNNDARNLTWVTRKENNNYGTRNKRASESRMKNVVCIETGITYKSVSEASKKTGVNIGSISSACNNRIEKAGGLHWEFKNI